MASPDGSYQNTSKNLSPGALSKKRKSEQINGLQNLGQPIGTAKRQNVLTEPQIFEVIPQQDRLCHRCKSLDLEDALKPPASVKGRLIMSLGEVTKDMRLSPCPLCRLFAAVHSPLKPRVRRQDANRGHHLRAFSDLAITSSKKRNLGELREPGVALGVVEGLNEVGFNCVRRRKCFAHGLIAPVASPSSRSSIFQVRLIDRTTADLEQIQKWLSCCDKSHGDICNLKVVPAPLKIQCIDCCTRSITTLIGTEVYYALSYVWGAPDPNSSPTQIHGDRKFLPSSGVPQVIEDSISVVKRLGGNYLWVDKYCIDQNEIQETQIQIDNMDKIYEGAYATIIAASGEDARSGLPGVSRARLPQPTALVGTHVFASTLPCLSLTLSTSKWMTRGWTYQEAILSRRCIYFTSHQVYFVCRSITSCESIDTGEEMKAATRNNENKLRADIFDTQFKRTSDRQGIWNFFDHLFYYKQRQLTHDSDSIKAFQGILSRSQLPNLWGVTIPLETDNDYDTAFARSLMWENPGTNGDKGLRPGEVCPSFRRRSEFPSWSWAGWDGPIRQVIAEQGSGHNSNSKGYKTHRPTNTRFFIQLKDGTQIGIRKFFENAKTRKLPDLSPYLHIESTVCRITMRRLKNFENPILCVCDVGGPHTCQGLSKQFVRIFAGPEENSRLHDRLELEQWDAIKLYDQYHGHRCAVFIVDWHSKVAEVIGVSYIHKMKFEFSSQRQETIKLS